MVKNQENLLLSPFALIWMDINIKQVWLPSETLGVFQIYISGLKYH